MCNPNISYWTPLFTWILAAIRLMIIKIVTPFFPNNLKAKKRIKKSIKV
ncbi:hypothetical protein FRA_31c04530 [Francisella sp. W12-1067]|nr:hypothetical protein FRA_31c04530 [Francisella sp. W12-1067]